MIQFGNRMVKGIHFLAYLDFCITALSFVMVMIEVFMLTSKLATFDHAEGLQVTTNFNHSQIVTQPNPLLNHNLGAFMIKIFYFVALFVLAETALAAFLIRALHRKNEREMRGWYIVMGIVTIFYLTDLIASIHAMSYFEDVPLSFAIVVKLPLLFLVWKYHAHLVSQHGRNLQNVDIPF